MNSVLPQMFQKRYFCKVLANLKQIHESLDEESATEQDQHVLTTTIARLT
jgi:hypothetical protein